MYFGVFDPQVGGICLQVVPSEVHYSGKAVAMSSSVFVASPSATPGEFSHSWLWPKYSKETVMVEVLFCFSGVLF